MAKQSKQSPNWTLPFPSWKSCSQANKRKFTNPKIYWLVCLPLSPKNMPENHQITLSCLVRHGVNRLLYVFHLDQFVHFDPKSNIYCIDLMAFNTYYFHISYGQGCHLFANSSATSKFLDLCITICAFYIRPFYFAYVSMRTGIQLLKEIKPSS